MVWALGIAGFILFFLYDWNRVFVKKSWMRSFFAAGCLCLIVCGSVFLADILRGSGAGRFAGLAAALVSFAGLIYTLFFAIPFDATYRQEASGRRVCRTGIYGCCRHPGIWWFFGCFLGLGLACSDAERVMQACLFSALNLGYAWYQDRYIFPREFCDYEDYQRKVPFLIPGKGWRGGTKDDVSGKAEKS